MNSEISTVNKFENEKAEKVSGNDENKKSLDQLRQDKINKQTEIDNLTEEKKYIINELNTTKNSNNKTSIEEKNNKIAVIKQEIENTENSYNKQINSYSNKYLSKKNNLRSEKSKELSKLNNKLTEAEAELNNKNTTNLTSIDNKISSEREKIQNEINKAKDEMQIINKNIASREGKIEKNIDIVKTTKGLNPLIDSLLKITEETGRTLITLFLTLLISLGFDLAACKTMQIYKQKLYGNCEGIDNPKLYLALTFILFFISAYATYTVFGVGRTGMDWFVGVCKTVGMEICKILFYVEYKKDEHEQNNFGFQQTSSTEAPIAEAKQNDLFDGIKKSFKYGTSKLTSKKVNLTKKPKKIGFEMETKSENRLPDLNKKTKDIDIKQAGKKLESNLSKITKLDFLRFISALYNPKSMYLGTYGTGYKKIIELTKLDKTKAKKIRDCLEMLEIIETKEIDYGKSTRNVTNLKISKAEALKKIFKIGGVL
jgi:hypothetical protein